MTDKLPYLALKSIPGVGLVLFQRLLARFGHRARVFEARTEELLGVKGVNRDLAQDLLAFRDWDRVEAEFAKMAAAGLEVVMPDDPVSRHVSSRSLIRRSFFSSREPSCPKTTWPWRWWAPGAPPTTV